MESTRRVDTIEGPPYWLLGRAPAGKSRRGVNGLHAVFTVESVESGAGLILPLFGSEASAGSFLAGLSPEERAGWRALEAGAGELLALLSDEESPDAPCAGVGEVAFDPRESLVDSGESSTPTVGRRVFMDRLLGRGGRWFKPR